jgi:DRG Family Regulatory Proteins, Tma46
VSELRVPIDVTCCPLAEMDPETQRKLEEAEAERARAEARTHGTPVTAETFAAWRARFDAERAAACKAAAAPSSAAAAAASAAAASDRKLTGKQWFLERDRSEVDADVDLDAEIDEDDEAEEDDDDEYMSRGGDLGDVSGNRDSSPGEADSDDDAFLDDFLAAAEDEQGQK